MRILILGGSTEASALARLLHGRGEIEARLSLAGRTAQPAPAPVPMRIGGFGGIAGLAAYLAGEGIEAVVDATHPFAAQMSRHAKEACSALGIPLVALTRAPWQPVAGDRWAEVADAGEAAAALGQAARRVFLTVGRLSLPAFAAAPHHYYLIRAIDEPVGLAGLPHHDLVLARPPFTVEGEERTMRMAKIDVVVSKNSGGAATYAKVDAARRLGLPVVMIRRPKPAETPALHEPEAVLDWIAHHARTP